MKTSRFIGMVILTILLSLNYISCNNENTLDNIDMPLSPIEKLYREFKDNQQIKCKTIINTDSLLTFAGLNNGYIWFVEYDVKTLTKTYEWKDNVKTDTIIRFYKQNIATFGKPNILYNIKPIFRSKTSTGEIHSFFYNVPDYDPRITEFGGQTIFKSSFSNKRTIIEYANSYKSIKPIEWYDDSFIIGSCLYRITGDSLYQSEELYNVHTNIYTPISYVNIKRPTLL